MNEALLNEESSRPWWREAWVSLAAGVAVVQFAAFWVLSPRDELRPSPRPMPRTQVHAVPGAPGTAPASDWLWLHAPSLALTTSGQDYSTTAWLRPTPSELVSDDTPAPLRPLPFAPLSQGAFGVGLALPRADPDPVPRWSLPRTPAIARDPGPIRVRAEGRLTLVDAPPTWRLAADTPIPAPPGGLVAAPAAVRLRLDDQGELAAPPVIWESSGQKVTDEAALAWVRSLRWQRGEDGKVRKAADEPMETTVLLVIEWPVPSPTPVAADPTLKR